MCTLFLELSNTVSIQIESSSEMLTYAWIQFHWIFEIHCKHFFNKIFAFYTLVALARIWSYVYCELWFYCSWTSVILPNIDIQHCIAFHVYTWPSVAVATILSQYQDYRAKANFKVLFRYWLCAIDNRNTFLHHHLHILVQRIFFFKSIPVCYVLRTYTQDCWIDLCRPVNNNFCILHSALHYAAYFNGLRWHFWDSYILNPRTLVTKTAWFWRLLMWIDLIPFAIFVTRGQLHKQVI